MIFEASLRNVHPDTRQCLFTDENNYVKINRFVSNVKCKGEQICARQVRDKKEVKILSKYSQSGCMFECQLSAAYFVQGDLNSKENDIGCLPWDFPKVFPDCK